MNSKVEKAVKIMQDIARDDTHGYDQIYRWGEKGDYDCSSLTITAFEQAGFPVKSKYGATYTGNMKDAYIRCGFKNVRNSINTRTGEGLKRGDILLNQTHHVAVYLGEGKLVQASINEKGTATYGRPGDQTGYEINEKAYYKYKYDWDCILRYDEVDTAKNSTDKPNKNNNQNRDNTKKNEADKEMVESKEFIVDGKKIKMDTIFKDNKNYVSLQSLKNSGILLVDYNKEMKIPIIASK